MVTKSSFGAGFESTEREMDDRTQFLENFRNTPIPEDELLCNLELFIKRQDLSRILAMHELYKMALNTHGVVMEFGSRWGRNLALFHSFRGMYEPFNHNRKIIGFDTFSGFPAIDEKDGTSNLAQPGGYSVSDSYEHYLEAILDFHEKQSPISHIRKYEVIKGDAVVELDQYLERHPETIIAFAYFDFDLYQPTKACLERILSHTTKGTVIGFDELNNRHFPGETLALKECLGLNTYGIRRFSTVPDISYIIMD